MSKGRIPKEGTIRRGDTKIKGGTRGESQGEHGGAKEVPRGCQREGVHKRGIIRGKPRWARGRWARGNEPREAMSREHFPTEGYQKGWDRVISKT